LPQYISGKRAAPGGNFGLPLVRLGPALLEIALAIVKVEAGDHAIAVEGNIIAQHRRKLRIGLHAEERAVQLGRNRALVLQVGNIGLHAAGGVETGETGGIGELRHCDVLSLRQIVCSTNKCASR
jgi:hypothetical protein